VPRLQDNVLDCVVYLYASKHEAEEGIGSGGSGFLLRVAAKLLPDSHFNFVVTNRHVVEGGAKCIRLNTKDGNTDVFEFDAGRLFVSKTDDLAIILLPTIPETYSINAIPRESLVTKEFIKEHDIGIGDEILMLGRFINREGAQRNSPTARFGHIAQMMGDPLIVMIGGKEHVQNDAILGEVRSIGGYSGSPVYVLPNRTAKRNGKPIPDDRSVILGIDFCHIQSWAKAHDQHGKELDHFQLPQNTGMAGIVPAWKVGELLDSGPVQKKLHECEKAELPAEDTANAKTESPNK
jgi:hypothetical protein